MVTNKPVLNISYEENHTLGEKTGNFNSMLKDHLVEHDPITVQAPPSSAASKSMRLRPNGLNVFTCLLD